ncbi:hypothetical protein [Stenotrophomonas maltophilia]|uniref:hypothetical protein n=1 Tax=Stenotrophomonas maltophilia TaxID=40324 RepID=UPI001312C41D|nr:hypothetical protein [Stenotrophomonas maltophilia]
MKKGKLQRFGAWIRGLQWAAIFMTLCALAIVVLRALYPEAFKLDSISVALIVLAVLPWLKSIVKSVEVAGLGKLELQDVEKAAAKIEDADLPKESVEDRVAPEDGGADSEPGQEEPAEEPSGYQVHDTDPTSYWDSRHFKAEASGAPTNGSSTQPFETSIFKTWRRDGTDADSQAQLRTAETILTISLAQLARQHGIGVRERRSTVRALIAQNVLDQKQGDAVVSAFSLLEAAIEGASSGLAIARVVSLAYDVASSLDVLCRRANQANSAGNHPRKTAMKFSYLKQTPEEKELQKRFISPQGKSDGESPAND